MLFHLYEMLRRNKIIEIESRTVVARGEKELEILFNGYRVLVLQDERPR